MALSKHSKNLSCCIIIITLFMIILVLFIIFTYNSTKQGGTVFTHGEGGYC